MTILEEISENLQNGKAKDVKALCEQALSEGIPASDILNKGLLAGMGVIGDRFRNNEIFVPEVLIAARAMNKGTAVLMPYLKSGEIQNSGTVVIGTVKGDLHDIGKNLCRTMMEGKGLNVIDLGADVEPEKFIESARENNADVIACSALLTTTMVEMKNVVDLLKASDLSGKVKIMIGGAPVTQAYCDEIGADYYTQDAASAAEKACEICAANK